MNESSSQRAKLRLKTIIIWQKNKWNKHLYCMCVCVLIFLKTITCLKIIYSKKLSSFMFTISVISPKQGLTTQVIWYYSNFFSTEIISYLLWIKESNYFIIRKSLTILNSKCLPNVYHLTIQCYWNQTHQLFK